MTDSNRFFVVPFTRTDSDDYSHACSVIVQAKDIKGARELVANRDDVDVDEFWSSEANDHGDRPEGCDDDGFYKSWPCECGDDDCGGVDGSDGHEYRMELIQFHFGSACEFASLEEARASIEHYAHNIVEITNE